jgi:hypothetical protein
VEVAGFNLQLAGLIMLVVGAIGLIASLIFWSSWGGFGGARNRDQKTTVVD